VKRGKQLPLGGGEPSPGEVVAPLQGQHPGPSGGFGEVEGGCAAVFLLGDKRSSKTSASSAPFFSYLIQWLLVLILKDLRVGSTLTHPPLYNSW